MRVRVTGLGDDYIDAEVIVGGVISNRKGVNLPGTVLDLSPLTAKDRADLAFGLELGVDWVALSFVQKPGDMIEARGLIGDRAGLVAKIEKPSALDQIDDIIRLSDAVMVARGDLGVEIPHEEVPGRQKELVRACRLAVKPVIVATQMLDSMVAAPDADAGGSIGRGDRHLRRRRCRHAVGGIRHRPLSARSGRDDGPDHPQHRTAQALPLDHRRLQTRRGAHGAACGRRRRRRSGRGHPCARDRRVHLQRHDRGPHRPQASRPCRSWR